MLTGTSGFVGRHLLAAFESEHSVTAMCRCSTRESREVVQDLAEPLDVERLPRRIDAVVHGAAIVGADVADEARLWRINVEATRELVEYAARAGARQFVFLSTGGVYAPAEERLREDAPIRPEVGYASSKLAAETLLDRYRSVLDVKILRLFFPYGPTQRNRLVRRLVERVARGLPVTLSTPEGHPKVTPLYVDDLVEYVRRVLRVDGTFIANVGGAEMVPIRAIAEASGALLNREPRFELSPVESRLGWCGDSSFVTDLTGHRPQVGFDAGLRRVVADYQEVA